MRIERITEADTVEKGADLFDDSPLADATARFLISSGHHLLFAYDPADSVIGMVSGVETTHPDKGTEMFLYELSVIESARRRGVATALVRALAALASERGCHGMWVGVDIDNEAALATYRRAAANDEAPATVFSWQLSGAS